MALTYDPFIFSHSFYERHCSLVCVPMCANQNTTQLHEYRLFGDIYLEEVIRGVVNQHDESSSSDVVNTPGEADEEDGRYMVNDLLLEVLKRWRQGEKRHGGKCWECVL